MALIEKLTAIADAIRAKLGTSDQMTLEQMADAVANIPTGSSDVPFPLGGLNARLIDEQNFSWSIADTSFLIGSTSSTSATSLRAAEQYLYKSPTFAIGDNDLVVVQTATATPVHGSAATGKVQQSRYVYIYVTFITKGRNSAAVATEGTRRYVNATSLWISYKNSSGTETLASASYGMYCTPSAASCASTTAASTYVRVSSPILYSRASTTYESAANMKEITACTWTWNVRTYAVDKGSTPAHDMIAMAMDELY